MAVYQSVYFLRFIFIYLSLQLKIKEIKIKIINRRFFMKFTIDNYFFNDTSQIYFETSNFLPIYNLLFGLKTNRHE